MKTKEIPAIVMLLAGGVYCLLGIYYQIPLMEFSVQLLIVLLIFWVFGGIVRMFLDKNMGEIEDKTKVEEEEEETEESTSEEDSEKTEDSEKEESDSDEE